MHPGFRPSERRRHSRRARPSGPAADDCRRSTRIPHSMQARDAPGQAGSRARRGDTSRAPVGRTRTPAGNERAPSPWFSHGRARRILTQNIRLDRRRHRGRCPCSRGGRRGVHTNCSTLGEEAVPISAGGRCDTNEFRRVRRSLRRVVTPGA